MIILSVCYMHKPLRSALTCTLPHTGLNYSIKYKKSFTQVYNVTTVLHCALLYILYVTDLPAIKKAAEIVICFNNQHQITSLEMLDDHSTLELVCRFTEATQFY